MGSITSALLGKNTRIYLAQTTDMVEKARLIHQTFPVATAAIGRSLTAASIMGTMLKGEKEKLTFQIKGTGLIKSIVAIAWSNGNVKAYISDPQIDIENHADGKLNVGGAIGKDGELIIIRDFGLKEPYIGRSELVSGEIAEDLAYYYYHSEQQPSVVSLGVLVGSDLSVKAAGGFILQTMPAIDEEELIALEAAVSAMPQISSVIAEEHTPEATLEILFPGMDIMLMDQYPVDLTCDCSKDKLEKALISIGREDLNEILEEDGQTTLTCHFCNTAYHFDKEDLENILISLDN
jgi:molecular chaperone Hsp33